MASVTAHEALVGGRVAHHPPGRAGFLGAVRSEFTKLRSVRSTYWTLFALVVVCVGIGALFSWGQTERIASFAAGHNLRGGGVPPGAENQIRGQVRSQAADISLFGLLIGQLVIVVLGALTITTEYSTGMIRTSLSSMPRRSTLYAAKASVFAAVALATGLVTSFLAFFVGQAILSTQQASTTLGYGDTLRQVIGAGLFLAVCGLLSFGIGAILRHSAAAITTGVGLLFVVMILSNFLPGGPPARWYGQLDIDKWIPFYAGSHIWQNQMLGVHPFTAWTGFFVFCAYAAAAVIGGYVLFRRRDA